MNCAFGPPELTETVRFIAENWRPAVSALPNAGMPIMVDGKSVFPMNPADFTKGMLRFVDEFGVGVVGGCCGTMPEHLQCCATRCGWARAGQSGAVVRRPQVSSLISAADVRQDKSYLIVAERTNTNGSRQFKRLLQADDWDGLVSMARDEMRDGSHVLDVCVDFVGRDGVRDMHEVVRRYVNSVNAPLMLDSTNPAVMEAGLKLAGGRCILNSMNLEDGEERLADVCRLAAHVRGGGRGGDDRRGQAQGDGPDAGAEDRHRHADPGPGREARAAGSGPDVRPAGAADQRRASRRTGGTGWRRSRGRG